MLLTAATELPSTLHALVCHSCLARASAVFTTRRTAVIDGLLLRLFDRVRQTAMYGCCDDPACDLQLMLHQFTLKAVDKASTHTFPSIRLSVCLSISPSFSNDRCVV